MSNSEPKLKEMLALKELTIEQLYDPDQPICRQNYLRLSGFQEQSHIGWREAKAIHEFLQEYLESVNVLKKPIIVYNNI